MPGRAMRAVAQDGNKAVLEADMALGEVRAGSSWDEACGCSAAVWERGGRGRTNGRD